MSGESVGRAAPGATLLTVVAIVLPTLLRPWIPTPYAAFAQMAAVFLWGTAIVAWAAADRGSRVPARPLLPWLVPLGLIGCGVIATWSTVDTVPGLMICALGALAMTALVSTTAARVATGPTADSALQAILAALVLAALLGTALELVQVLLPQWADGFWIARPKVASRPGGNLMQANQLASLQVWGLIACALMVRRSGLRFPTGLVVAVILAIGIALTASRTGLLELSLLLAFVLFDRSLGRQARALVVVAAAAVLVVMACEALWAVAAGPVGAGLTRSSARSSVYLGSLVLILRHPWFGVGWGEFGSAWALSPGLAVDGRWFNHAHSLFLNLAVELGLPLTLGVALGIVGVLRALWRRRHLDEATLAFLMVATIGVHSMLEHPLWYGYFLLPLAWAIGLGVGRGLPSGVAGNSRGLSRWAWVGLVLSACTLATFVDHLHGLQDAVRALRAPQSSAPARESRLFGHFAAQAAATSQPEPDLRLFAQARLVVIDDRLLEAWARALARAGRLDESRLVAWRLRAALTGAGSHRVVPCEEQVGAAAGLPCAAPSRSVDWRALRQIER